MWGWTAPDGREFAIVGERTGTWIVETTDPRNPVERGYFAGPASTWREITSYRDVLYSVSESHGGVRVIDMATPSLPQDLGVQLDGLGGWSNTHTISVDPTTGRLYANGATGGMRVLDVATDPRNPVQLGVWTGDYVHDVHVRGTRGYFSHIIRGTQRIVDVTGPVTFVTRSNVTTPGIRTHNVWVTDDERWMFTTDENPTGAVSSYDITNPALPLLRGTYAVPGAITHLILGIGRTGYVAAYVDGFHMIDLADPAAMRLVARYDTSTELAGFNGAWGVYPHADSGVIYISDVQRGLFLLQVDAGHLNRFGSGRAGANGVPRASFDGGAIEVAQSTLRLELARLDPGAPFLLAVGTAQGSGSVFGVDIHVDLGGALLLGANADGAGRVSMPFPIPADNSLAGARIWMQVFSASGGALTASRGMWFGIAPRS